jgi:hypothetical protein
LVLSGQAVSENIFLVIVDGWTTDAKWWQKLMYDPLGQVS